MLRYTTYTCDTCKRSKDILSDSQHLQLDYCTITKGCAGHLSKTRETNTASNTPVVSGLQDWYPRGKSVTPTPAVQEEPKVTLSCSATGTLTIAVRQSDAVAALDSRAQLTMRFLQRKVEPISFQKYIYKLETLTDEVFGRDTTGKNLRIEPVAKGEGRVSVKVNGVDTEFTIPQSNKIKLSASYPINTIVTIVVAAEKDTVERDLVFTRHSTQSSTVNFGAWDNIRFLKSVSTSGGEDANSWWMYSCTDLGAISNSTSLQVVSVLDKDGIQIISGPALADVRFMLASAPYANVDRYYNFVVEAMDAANGFPISSPTTSMRQLQVTRSTVAELYPPLRVRLPTNSVYAGSSYIQADTIVGTNSSQVVTNTAAVRLSGRKVIGPV